MTTFKILSIALTLTLVFDCSCSLQADKSKVTDTSQVVAIIQKIDTSLNGFYKGLEYRGITTDPAYPGKYFKSYYLGDLKIKGDSVFLDQSPISIYKGDTLFSASDGGFYYYSGTVQKSDTTILLNLKELFCDYCGTLIKTNAYGQQEVVKRTKQLKSRLTDKGFIIDGYLYAKTTKKEDLISEHPEPYLKLQ